MATATVHRAAAETMAGREKAHRATVPAEVTATATATVPPTAALHPAKDLVVAAADTAAVVVTVAATEATTHDC